MTIQEQLARLREKKFANVYLLVGTEEYLASSFKQTLVQEVMNSEDDEFNISTFDMEETPLASALGEAETLPFFGDYRVVFINNAYFLTAERRATDVTHDLDLLINYLAEPAETTILVLQVQAAKLDERKKITKQVKKAAEIVTVNPMSEHEIKSYLQHTLQADGYEMTPEAFELLLQLTDLNLSKIMSELQKLYLFDAEHKKITAHTVQELVPKSLEHNVFELTTQVLNGQGEAALRLYEDLLLQGEEPIKLNAILLNQLRLFIQTKILMNLGYQQANIAETLKVHPYRVKLALQQVKRLDAARLADIYDELVENDFKMKTGQLAKELLFELFILKLAHAN